MDPRGRLGMSMETGPAPEPLTRMRAGRIDTVWDRFEALWRTGRRPRIEDCLQEPGAAEIWPDLLRKLWEVELPEPHSANWRRRNARRSNTSHPHAPPKPGSSSGQAPLGHR